MLVWCIWLSVCVSGSDLPLFLSVVWICRLALATHHGASCACVRVLPLWPWGLRAVAQWVAQGHTCGHRLADAACSRQSGACGARRMCFMVLTCELSWFVVTNPHVRVRRSSAANWGGMVMQEGRGVLASGVLRRVTAATVGLGGRAWKVQDSSCDAPAMVRASFWSFEGLEFGRKRLGCQTWSGVLRRNGRWLRQHFQELGVSSAGVCLDAAVIWSIGCWVSGLTLLLGFRWGFMSIWS